MKMEFAKILYSINALEITLKQMGEDIEILKERVYRLEHSVRELDYRIFGQTKIKVQK